MADHRDPDDQSGQRRTHHSDDPELEKVKEDTAHIFVQFVRLHSHSVSSNATVIDSICPDLSLTESPSNSTTIESSRNGATAAPGPSSSTLPRQKSTDAATRKDPHPKAVYSTKIVSNPQCSAGESSAHSSRSNSTRSNRPDKLSLSGRVLKRVPSATGSDNGSSGKTTPAQDPPMELMSPGTGVGELSASYPSSSSTAQSDRINREWLIRSADHETATAAAASSSQASCTTSQEKERHFPSVVSTMHTTCVYWLYLLQFPGCNSLYNILVLLRAAVA